MITDLIVPKGAKVSVLPDGTIDVLLPKKTVTAQEAPPNAPAQAPAAPAVDLMNVLALTILGQVVINLSGGREAAPANAELQQKLREVQEAISPADKPKTDAVTAAAAPVVKPATEVEEAPKEVKAAEAAPVVITPAAPAPKTDKPVEPAPVTAAPAAKTTEPTATADEAAHSAKERMLLIQKLAVKARFKLQPEQLEELAKMPDFTEAGAKAKIDEWKAAAKAAKANPTTQEPAAPVATDATTAEVGDGSAFAEFLK